MRGLSFSVMFWAVSVAMTMDLVRVVMEVLATEAHLWECVGPERRAYLVVDGVILFSISGKSDRHRSQLGFLEPFASGVCGLSRLPRDRKNHCCSIVLLFAFSPVGLLVFLYASWGMSAF